LSISSFTSDVLGIVRHANIGHDLTVVAHSMGCLVALQFAIEYPELVKTLILMGPPPSPLPKAGSDASHARAKLVREKGMVGVVDAVATAGTSEKTKIGNPMAVTAVRLSLMGQDPEGYAKACSALANSTAVALDIEKVKARTVIITGSEDKVSPPALGEKMKTRMPNCEEVVVLEDVGHWHLFEDTHQVSQAVLRFLNKA